MPPKRGMLDIDNRFKYKIGTNASENWRLLNEAHALSKTNPDAVYFWFHVDGYSSAYVILETPYFTKLEDTHCKKIAYEAAVLCKQHSKAKNILGLVDVIYCLVENVKCGEVLGEAIIKDVRKCKFIKV
jgi:predicted ribosome quality control (RQC) complex YloA/Tae2 family protein